MTNRCLEAAPILKGAQDTTSQPKDTRNNPKSESEQTSAPQPKSRIVKQHSARDQRHDDRRNPIQCFVHSFWEECVECFKEFHAKRFSSTLNIRQPAVIFLRYDSPLSHRIRADLHARPRWI